MNDIAFNEGLRKVNEVRGEIKELGTDLLLKEAVDQLESRLVQKDNECRITVAVCGQYSAGKSTLIRALTGDQSIKIGQDVTTGEIKTYDWNGNLLADTPGICAGHANHDEKSKAFMATADLLVYMVTIQGFDRIVEPDFRKLILGEYPEKSMLLMNKRNEEPAENESNWRMDAEGVAGAEMLKKLRFTIVDVEDYMTGMRENAPELVELSGFNEFVAQLNDFIKEKGLLGRIVSRIDEMNRTIVLCREDFLKSPLKDEFTRRGKKAVNTAIRACETALRDASVRLRQKVKDMKHRLVGLLADETMDKFKEAQDGAQLELETLIGGEQDQLTSEFERVFAEMEDDFAEISADARRYEDSLMDVASKLPNFDKFGAIDLTFFKTGFAGVGKLLGGITKDGLVQVVHFFGGSFKPWGATKLCNVLKFLGPWLAGATTLLDGAQMLMDKKHQAELEGARKTLMSSFDEIADEIAAKLDEFKAAETSPIVRLKEKLAELEQKEREDKAVAERKQALAEKLTAIKNRLDEIRLQLV